MNNIIIRLLPYLIVGVLTFSCAEGLMSLYEHMTKATPSPWMFIPAWILSIFLLYAVLMAGVVLCAAGCYVIVWIAERQKKRQ